MKKLALVRPIWPFPQGSIWVHFFRNSDPDPKINSFFTKNIKIVKHILPKFKVNQAKNSPLKTQYWPFSHKPRLFLAGFAPCCVKFELG